MKIYIQLVYVYNLNIYIGRIRYHTKTHLTINPFNEVSSNTNNFLIFDYSIGFNYIMFNYVDLLIIYTFRISYIKAFSIRDPRNSVDVYPLHV